MSKPTKFEVLCVSGKYLSSSDMPDLIEVHGPNQKANARLINAARELLEAAKLSLIPPSHLTGEAYWHEKDARFAALITAIAKAGGDEP